MIDLIFGLSSCFKMNPLRQIAAFLDMDGGFRNLLNRAKGSFGDIVASYRGDEDQQRQGDKEKL